MFNATTILLLGAAFYVSPHGGECGPAPIALRVTTTRAGLHAISYADLAPHWDLSKLLPSKLALRRQGELVAWDGEGLADGSFDRGDVVVFYAPEAASLGRRTLEFVLSADGGGRRYTPQELSSEGAVDEALVSFSLGSASEWAQRESIAEAWADPAREPKRWIHARLLAPLQQQSTEDATRHSATSFVTAIDPPPLSDRAGTLALDLMGPPQDGLAKSVSVVLNGRRLGDVEWTTTGVKHAEFACAPGQLKSANTISLVNSSTVARYAEEGNELAKRERSFVEVHGIQLQVASLLYGPGNPEEQTSLRVVAANAPRRLTLATRSRHAWKVYDVSRGLVARNHRLDLPANCAAELVAAGMAALHPVQEVAPMAQLAATLPPKPVDWVCITASRFKPHAETLALHRSAQGLATCVVSYRDIRDAVAHGGLDPEAPRQWLRALAKATGRAPKFLLLFGDADRDTDRLSEREIIPAYCVPTLYNGASAADSLLGDLDGDGFPEVAVGRISARNDEAARELVVRILKLETQPVAGPWRSELNFCAGEGGFAPAIDSALRTVAMNVLTRELPTHLGVRVLDASSNMADEDFAVTLGRRLDEGALCFTYAGHAQRTALAPRVKSRLRMLKPESARQVAAGGRTPLALLLACSAGEFDAPGEDCLAEELLFARDGLCALIASTRISHPFPNALLGRALARTIFTEPSVGEALLAAQRGMTTDAEGAMGQLAGPFLSKAIDRQRLVRDHVALYALLGDPAMRLPLPSVMSDLRVEGDVASGSDLVILGTCPTKGTLTARVEALREGGSPLARATLSVDGAFRIVLPVPAGIEADALRVHVHVDGTDGSASAGNLLLKLPKGN